MKTYKEFLEEGMRFNTKGAPYTLELKSNHVVLQLLKTGKLEITASSKNSFGQAGKPQTVEVPLKSLKTGKDIEKYLKNKFNITIQNSPKDVLRILDNLANDEVLMFNTTHKEFGS